jgi:hypothetical protein
VPRVPAVDSARRAVIITAMPLAPSRIAPGADGSVRLADRDSTTSAPKGVSATERVSLVAN